MQHPTGYRILRATVLAGLAALTLSTHVFVDVDRIRARVVRAPVQATAGLVRASTAGASAANELKPPFALIARITSQSPGTTPFSVTVDGTAVCTRELAGGGSRRMDCAVAVTWNPAIAHDVAIQGPATPWTLESLELSTHHGSTDGVHYGLVLPAASSRYVRPAFGWVVATWLMLTAALLLLPASPSRPRWMWWPYKVVAGAVVLELALSQSSQWISDYRVVLSAGTFARLLVLLFVPRLWAAGRVLTQTAAALVAVQPTARRRVEWAIALIVLVAGVAAWRIFPNGSSQISSSSDPTRERLFAELQPVRLSNCEFKRFGEQNDGGYVLCANLLGSAQSGYSYGISGYDQWGCDVSHALAIPVHEYDCFNLQVPACPGGRTVFHGECIGGEAATIDGRPFDSLEHQFAKNGDGVKRVVVKMDVEGAEWDSLLRTPDEVLQRIDQLTIELHGVREPARFVAVVAKLKQFFYVANLHYNNFACLEGIAPFPSEVYEALFVSKRLAMPGGPGPAGAPPGLTAVNNPQWKDCQSLADLPPVRPPDPAK